MSDGTLHVEPDPWMGGKRSDYVVERLSNGGAGTRHLLTGKVLPHVLIAPQKVANPPQGGGSLLAKLAEPLQAVNAVTGILNLGVGIYNGFQIHQLRKEIPQLRDAIAAASEERRALHAETMQALGLAYDQGARLLREHQVGLERIDEQFAVDRADRVAERMIALELARRDLALSADPHHARVLEDKANEALARVFPQLARAAHPQARLPLVAYAVQAYTAKVDANLALAALHSQVPSRFRVAQQARLDALGLIQAEQTRALAGTFADNYHDNTGLWLPDGYFAMYQAVTGSGILEAEDAREVIGLVAPTRAPISGWSPAPGLPAPVPSSRIWTPTDGPERLWRLRDGLATGPEPADGGWSEGVPTFQEVAEQLGTELETTDLALVLAAAEIRSSTPEVLLDDALEAQGTTALAPLTTLRRVLIDAEAVLWALEESLLKPDESVGGSDPGGPLGLFRGLRVAFPDASRTIHAALTDARNFLPPVSRTRSDLELLAIVNAALTMADDPAEPLGRALSRPDDVLWCFVALEVHSLTSQPVSPQVLGDLVRALERVGSALPETRLALDRLMWSADREGHSATSGLWLDQRVAQSAARLAEGQAQRMRAIRAARHLQDPWGPIFRAAEKVNRRPRDGRNQARAGNATERIEELAGVSDEDRARLNALF